MIVLLRQYRKIKTKSIRKLSIYKDFTLYTPTESCSHAGHAISENYRHLFSPRVLQQQTITFPSPVCPSVVRTLVFRKHRLPCILSACIIRADCSRTFTINIESHARARRASYHIIEDYSSAVQRNS